MLKALGMLSAGLAGLAVAVVPLAVAADQGGSSGATPHIALLRLAPAGEGVAPTPALPTERPTIRFMRTHHGHLVAKPGLTFVIR